MHLRLLHRIAGKYWSRLSGAWRLPGSGGDFWTGLTGFSGFTGLEHNPQRIYEMACLGCNPVNPLNPVNPEPLAKLQFTS